MKTGRIIIVLTALAPGLCLGGVGVSRGFEGFSAVFALLGLLIGCGGAFAAVKARTATPAQVLCATIGLLSGGTLAALFISVVRGGPDAFSLESVMWACLFAWSAIVGGSVGLSKAEQVIADFRGAPDASPRTMTGILDTSAIIDGRVADVCETGFISGTLIVPRFVLEELQMVADSTDGTKRARGRRGLEVLNRMKKRPFVEIVVEDKDYPNLKDVDQKLIRLAKERRVPLITNDFNLNKVAEVHSITVLNFNRLANALKPNAFPGEVLRVRVVKVGKEAGQGIAYLDDGAMVVVENGLASMGREVDATVSSVIQTAAGRMIFTTVK